MFLLSKQCEQLAMGYAFLQANLATVLPSERMPDCRRSTILPTLLTKGALAADVTVKRPLKFYVLILHSVPPQEQHRWYISRCYI